MAEERKTERTIRRNAKTARLLRGLELAIDRAEVEKQTGEIVLRIKVNQGGVSDDSLQVITKVEF